MSGRAYTLPISRPDAPHLGEICGLEAAGFALPEPSYRLLMTDLAAQDPDDGRRPSATLAPAPAAAARMAVQANAADRDETIERRVEQERREIDGGDLLRADARTE